VPSEDIELTMQGIYYDLDKWDVRPDARVILDSLAAILNNNTNLVIELASHTDSRAPAAYNLDLSKKRAQSCVNYLLQKGIQKERLVAVGYGETKLVNDCSDEVDCTEEEHQQNRRTTVRIIRTDFKPKR
jgi:outer membrane protein OmpA-like peptidoglycan-associated protein